MSGSRLGVSHRTQAFRCFCMWHIQIWLICTLLSLFPASVQVMAERKAANPLLADERTRIVRVRVSSVASLSWDLLAAAGWDLASVL
jgi:hypothetical protein